MTNKDEEMKAYLQALYSSAFGSPALGELNELGGEQHATQKSPGTPATEQHASDKAADAPITIFASAPGRVELAGNHTDHQGGCTIAAALTVRAYALAVSNGSDTIRASMEKFGDVSFKIDSLEPREDERGTSLSLIRGMAAAYAQSGKELRGFNMVTCSDIPVGQGISSSAAFEVLVGAVIHALCDFNAFTADTAAASASEEPQSAQTALVSASEEPQPIRALASDTLMSLALEAVNVERTYFGKPCGAQDQLASAFGGVSLMNFAEETPHVQPIDIDLSATGYAAFLVDSQADHSAFTDEYAGIPLNMLAIARYFGAQKLEEISYGEFLEQLPQVREKCGDKAALAALHYFAETQRVKEQALALQNNDFSTFLEGVRLSGASSAQYLQNVSPQLDGTGVSQPAMVILALCTHLLDGAGLFDIISLEDETEMASSDHGSAAESSDLKETNDELAPPVATESLVAEGRQSGANRSLSGTGRRPSGADRRLSGAYRIHGGGFGGSILVFVPEEVATGFQTSVDALLGYDACMPISVDAAGVKVERLS